MCLSEIVTKFIVNNKLYCLKSHQHTETINVTGKSMGKKLSQPFFFLHSIAEKSFHIAANQITETQIHL